MEKIILASNNQHKIKEFKQILKDYEILPLSEIGFDEEIEENGTTFQENSKIKVDAISKYLKDNNLEGYMVMGDDSGLCVDALDGAPGVFSARYAEEHNTQANRDLLLKNLNGIENREAKFVCVITLKKPNGEYIVSQGEVKGRILTEETGDTSFGYDCLFFSHELQKSFGHATPDEKNAISHRGRAIQNLLAKL
ncbi:MAG: RdgB/HAM1 family non-canonical purine NTP pyrophosphatase [Clostridia bacterium]|nr:RdgB/HAM1 family non-canonical purine NTP pyrophosphatase [Clostridia bacterium]